MLARQQAIVWTSDVSLLMHVCVTQPHWVSTLFHRWISSSLIKVVPEWGYSKWHYVIIGSDSTWWHHQMETFSCYWPFKQGIHLSPVNSPHKSQWRWALMFSLICVWIHGWVNNGEAGDLRCHRAHYDDIVMAWCSTGDKTLSEPMMTQF